MPDGGRTTSELVRILRKIVLIAVVLLGVTGLGGTSVSAQVPAPAPAAADGEIIGGINVDQAVAGLADDAVVMFGGLAAQEKPLADIAANARSQGIDLSIVVSGQSLSKLDTENLALAVAAQVGGVVLVLTPATVSLQGPQVSESKRTDASEAAQAAGADNVAAAQAAADSLTAKEFPWTLVIIGVIVLAVIGAVVGRFWEKRRKSKADEGELAELTKNLSERVGNLAPLIIKISPQIEIAQRPDLEEKFNVASADYNKLLDAVSRPLASRQEVDSTTAAIADLEKRLTAIDGELNQAAPGIQPPSPAG